MRRPANEVGEVDGYELFAAIYPTLRRFAAVVADADMDPDDLVQDALASTLARHDLSEIRDPAAYLRRAMLNDVKRTRRRAGLFRRLMPKLAGEPHTVDAYPSDLAAVDELAPLDRAVLLLVDVEGMSSTEAADQLGLTATAVRKRASRARATLRTLLGENIIAIPSPEVSE